MERIKTYYQPEFKDEDGGLPEGLYSFMAFKSQDDCKGWLKNNGFNPEDFEILEYHDQDIEDATVIDDIGDLVQFTGFVEQYTIEAGLRRAETLDEFEDLLDVYGEKRLDEEKIDDGCVGSEDSHVMMRRYSLSVKGYKKPFTVRVYYGEVSEAVGLVEISDNEVNPSEEDYKNMPTSSLSRELDTQELLSIAGDIRNAALAAMGIDYENLTDAQAQRVDLAIQQVIEKYN